METCDPFDPRRVATPEKNMANTNLYFHIVFRTKGRKGLSRRHDAAMIRMRQEPDLDASASKVIKKVL